MIATRTRTIVGFLFLLYVVFLSILYSYESARIDEQKSKILNSYMCINFDISCNKNNLRSTALSLKEKPVEYPRYGFYESDPLNPENSSLVLSKEDNVFILSMPNDFMDIQNSFILAISIIFLFLLIAFAFVFYLFYEKMKIINYALEEKNGHLKKIALTDNLTGCFNRHHLKQHVIEYIEKSIIFKEDVFFGFVDIDHFKSINDNFGHDVGDIILKELSYEINQILPKEYSPGLYRIGGEEFLIVLYGMKERDVFQIIKNIYNKFEYKKFKGFDSGIGLSIGMTKVSKENDSESEILKRADNSLYQAKESGRNKMIWRLNDEQ